VRALRVLLVDDHDLFRDSATRLLSSQGLDVVRTAASGEEAVELTHEERFDVVLVDLVLPGMDGVAVAYDLAKRSPPPAVIIISSHSEAGEDPRVRAAPVLGFIAKRELSCSAVLTLVG
jgi:DNA-binding NarL/FixJ family response regulator